MKSQDAPLQVSFMNGKATPTTAWLATATTARAAEVTPIPEPQTYALMLAGLVASGVVFLRRERR